MTTYTNVPSDLYVSISDLSILEDGGETRAYIQVSSPNEYELINKHAFQPSIQLDDNTFLVAFIMK